MRLWLPILLISLLSAGSAATQEDKKTDDLKPADPDTGESTVEETTHQICRYLYRRDPRQSFRRRETG
jgi:hypothetical protein